MVSWNEIRVRAATFAKEWKDAKYEKGETQSFYNDFFEVFDIKRRSVARYEEHVTKLDNTSGFIDLFLPGKLIVEQKSSGRDLDKAYGQAGEYFDALPETDRPRYILVSDFQTFELHDLDEREVHTFSLQDLPQEVEEFGFIVGVQRRKFRDQDPANIKAAELVGKLHDALDETGYKGTDLEYLLVRIAFCLFADDTGIFNPRDIFLDYIEHRTSRDGADLGPLLMQLFEVLDTPLNERLANLDEDLIQFPYVNGDLFARPLRTPAFNSVMREALLDACRFDWSNISPAIFGALFQSVMDPKQRRAQGIHYTTEKNILKVIEPLFMDDLHNEFRRLKVRRDNRRSNDLKAFQKKLGGLSFFDPACGCGNFLIIAYREIRLLEMDVIRELIGTEENYIFDVSSLSVVDVHQFFGIEINEFPVRIAETALWMMDHIMNNRLSLEFGHTYARIPLESAPSINHGDALELDWTKVLSPEDCSFVFGNPPFSGSQFQTKEQRNQVRRIAGMGGRGNSLDFVCAWFIKAGEYVGVGRSRIGFVATNSVVQGKLVAQLWPILFTRCALKLAFAHRTFAWGSDARGKAHVHVVIIGLDRRDVAKTETRLFSYADLNREPHESKHKSLSPYLVDASKLANPHLSVQEERLPLNHMRQLMFGTQPLENGNLTFTADERELFISREPLSVPFFRPFIGAKELLQNQERWILHTADIAPARLHKMPLVRERLHAVKSFRAKSSRKTTKKLSDYPTSYGVTTVPTRPFLSIPRVSSESREYVPLGWLKPPSIPSEATLILPDANLREFGLLTSAMHMTWLRHIGGRLKSDYRYSIGLVYNTFPVPPGFTKNQGNLSRVEELAQAVLDARASHRDATLADLYDPIVMPLNLRKAHDALDRAIDRLYRSNRFDSEHERFEFLFKLYEELRTPLGTKTKRQRRKSNL